MNTETNFMSFENLTKLIEEHKKETHPYKRYEFDSTSYTMLLISINNLIKENQELKKQLEETDRKLFFTKNELDMRQKSIDNKLNQQKEFIKYLEDMLDDENDIFSVVRVKDVLRKYKETTGVEDENTIK